LSFFHSRFFFLGRREHPTGSGQDRIMKSQPFLRGVRAVVFDAVGTLIHPHPPAAAVYATVGRRSGSRLSVEAAAARFATAFARQDALDLEAGLRTSEERETERWRQIVAEVLADAADPGGCFAELYAHFGRPEAWRCDPEAAVTLQGLAARGYTLGVASNYDRRLRSVVAGLPTLRAVHHVVISAEVGWRKPAREFFAALCRHIGFAAGQILYVGDDRANDYDGARSAGLRALLFDRRAHGENAAVERIERLGELLAGMG
jgi:putative hydrolase of the HAD superfamily